MITMEPTTSPKTLFTNTARYSAKSTLLPSLHIMMWWATFVEVCESVCFQFQYIYLFYVCLFIYFLFVCFYIFYMFVWSQIRDECLTCRNAVAVFDMSYFGKFYLTGPDAKKAADWLFTADVNKAPGEMSPLWCDVCLPIQSPIHPHWEYLFSTFWSVIILIVCVFQAPQSTPAC